MHDVAHDNFIFETAKTKQKDCKSETMSMVRGVLPSGSEYITHGLKGTELDRTGNTKTFTGLRLASM